MMDNKLKKAISVFLAVIMLGSCLAFAEELSEDTVAEVTEEVTEVVEEKPELVLTTKQQLAVELAKGMGIIEKDTDLTQKITRAAFSNAMYILLDIGLVSSSAADIFADVNSKTEFLNAVSVLYDMKKVQGYKGSFYPTDIISRDHAVIIALNILGLDEAVKLYGGNQTAYNRIADDLDILDGVGSSAEGMTYLDLAIMLENMLNCDLTTYSNMCGITGYYMTAVLDMYKVEGIITDNGRVSIYNDESVGEQKLQIGNDTFLNNSADVVELLGRKVVAYYREIDGENVIIAISPNGRDNLIILQDRQIQSFENFQYEYYENDESTRLKNVKLETNYNIIYNGKAIKDARGFNISWMVPEQGTVRLVDNDDNDKYDIVIINRYETFIVEKYESMTEILSFQNNEQVFNFKEADEVYIQLAGGTTELTVENITYYGYVLSAAVSLDRKILDIRLCSEYIEGTINQVNKSEKTIKIDGVEHRMIEDEFDRVQNATYAKFYKNHYDTIIYCDPSSNKEYQTAFLAKCMYTEDWVEYSGEVLMIHLYTEGNIYRKTIAAKKMQIDGEVYKTPKKMESALSPYVGTLVKFKSNSEGQITWIDTIYFNSGEENENETMNLLYENNIDAGVNFNSLSWGTGYTKKVPTIFDTKVFAVKRDYVDGNDMYCYPIKDFYTMYGQNPDVAVGELTVYNNDRESMVADTALAIRSSLCQNYSAKTTILESGAVVTAISKRLASNDELCYSLKLKRGNLEGEVLFSEDAIKFSETGEYSTQSSNPYTISVGDLIRWRCSPLEKDEAIVQAGDCRILYDCSEGIVPNTAYLGKVSVHTGYWHYIWLLDREADWFVCVNQHQTPVETYADSENPLSGAYSYVDYIKPNGNKETYVHFVDSETGKMEDGSVGDIKSYKEYGTECSKMMGLSENDGHRVFIVYE